MKKNDQHDAPLSRSYADVLLDEARQMREEADRTCSVVRCIQLLASAQRKEQRARELRRDDR